MFLIFNSFDNIRLIYCVSFIYVSVRVFMCVLVFVFVKNVSFFVGPKREKKKRNISKGIGPQKDLYSFKPK